MENQDREFRRGQHINLRIALTGEQHAALKEWAESVPTLFFLDICAANAAKLSEAQLAQSPRKAALVAGLRKLDRPQHCFSYLCALMEKVSDSRGLLSDADLQSQILDDLKALRGFFKEAKVYEPDDFATRYLRDLRGRPTEIDRPKYLAFLKALNGPMALGNPVSPALRLEKAKAILQEADELSVSRQHPVVLLALASLYGNLAAKKVFRFKADSTAFNAEGALADIMSISRFAERKLQIEQDGREGGRFLQSKFITDDDGLTVLSRCFEAVSVKIQGLGGKVEFKFNVKLGQLLTDLQSQLPPEGASTDSLQAGPSEYEQLLQLLSPNIEGA